MDSLHLGSRIPLKDLQSTLGGHHTLVDPYFAFMPKSALRKLSKEHPNFEFSPKTAHAFLDKAITEGISYATIRIDSPYTGIIDKSSDFGLLCKKMQKVLAPHGKVLILTEYEPGKVGVLHKFGDDANMMNNLLRGREISELDEDEIEKLRGSVKEEKTADVVKELMGACFKVEYSEAPRSAIQRSETAVKRAASGKKIYLIVATKGL